jgi:hypothetical protein
MEKEDLIKKIELSNNKLSIFADTKEIEKYDLDEVTLLNLINRFLTDNEKTKLFEFEYFKRAPANVIRDIVYSISEDKLKVYVLLDVFLKDKKLLEKTGKIEMIKIIKSLNDDQKMQILKSKNFEKFDLEKHDIEAILESMTDETKKTVLKDEDLLAKHLKLRKNSIIGIINSIKSDEIKLDIIDEIGIDKLLVSLSGISYENKRKVLLENRYNMNKEQIVWLISSMEVDSLIEFLNENQKFLSENKIKAYEIIYELGLDEKKQYEVMAKFGRIKLGIRRSEINLCNFRKKSKRIHRFI